MGQGARKLAEDADASEMRELLALLLGIDLRPLPARDIPVRQDCAALRSTERDDGELEPARGGRAWAVILHTKAWFRSVQDRYDPRRGPRHLGIIADPSAGIEVVGSDRRPSEFFFGALAGEARPGIVDGDDDAEAINDGDVLAKRSQHGAPKNFQAAQIFRDPASFGDVYASAKNADGLARGMGHELSAGEKPSRAAV